MKKLNSYLLMAMMLLSFSQGLSASQEASTTAEINYLLQQIELTECTFNRNGSRHQGAEAVAHIQRKYDYYYDDIESAEDFIRLSASKSTVTRRAYTIECSGGEVQSSEQWLLQRLQDYRLDHFVKQ